MNEQNTNESLFNIEWHSLIRDIIRNFWAIILAGCIMWMGTWVYEYSIYTPKFTSSSILVVRSKLDTTGAYAGLSTTSGMAKVFAEVFRQPALKRLAAENIGMDSFAGTVAAVVQEDTNVITLSVTSSDPKLSFQLLNSILKVYPDISEMIFTNAVINVLHKPEMPISPSNPISSARHLQFTALAIVLQAGIIVLLSFMRNTVKNERMFDKKIDAKLLGTVTHEKPHMTWKERLQRVKRALLVDDAFTSLRFSEDYQRLANKLEYAHYKSGARMFTITSVGENEGKSTTAVNIALALAARGYRVALLDLDVRKPAIHKIFGVKSALSVDLSDVLAGKNSLREFRFHRYKRSNLLMALNKTSRTDSGDWLSNQHAHHILSVIRDRMDFVIIDSSPLSVSADAVHLTEIAEYTLLVVRTDMIIAEDINDAVLTISGAGGNLLGCVLNDVHKSFTLFGQMGVDESGYYQYRYSKRYSGEGYSKILEDDTFDYNYVGDQKPAMSLKQEQHSDGHENQKQ